jgi:transposase
MSPTARMLEPHAAGVDIGATETYVAIPADRDPQPVRRFSTFTRDLEQRADSLKQHRIESVAMESTGVF